MAFKGSPVLGDLRSPGDVVETDALSNKELETYKTDLGDVTILDPGVLIYNPRPEQPVQCPKAAVIVRDRLVITPDWDILDGLSALGFSITEGPRITVYEEEAGNPVLEVYNTGTAQAPFKSVLKEPLSKLKTTNPSLYNLARGNFRSAVAAGLGALAIPPSDPAEQQHWGERSKTITDRILTIAKWFDSVEASVTSPNPQ